MALTVSDIAPDFTLASDTGELITLSSIKKPVVLYFYPKDHTPGCTKESCDFRDHFDAFSARGVQVFGISKDSSKTHTSFKTKHKLPFTLLVDEHADVCEAYGVVNQKNLFGKTFLGIERSTFLIDEGRVIRAVWRKVKVPGHVEQVLNELTKES